MEANRTFIGSVVCVDLVGYSKRTVAQQGEIKQAFNKLLMQVIRKVPAEDRIILDTGDGAAISFLGDPEDSLAIGLKLRDAMNNAASKLGGTSPEGGPVRIGINLGPLRVSIDMNGHPKIIGDGLNVAEKICAFANPGQIVVSRPFHDMVSRISDKHREIFHYEGTRTDRNVREHEIYSVLPAASDVAAAAKAKTLPPVPPPKVEASGPAGEGGLVAFLRDPKKWGVIAVALAGVIAWELSVVAGRMSTTPTEIPAEVAKAPEPPKTEPPKVADAPKPTQAPKPIEAPKKVDPPKPEPAKPVEATKPTQAPKPIEAPKKVDPPKPEPAKPVEAPKKAEPPKAEPPKAVEPRRAEPPKKVEPPKTEPKPEPPKKVEAKPEPKPEPPKKAEPERKAAPRVEEPPRVIPAPRTPPPTTVAPAPSPSPSVQPTEPVQAIRDAPKTEPPPAPAPAPPTTVATPVTRAPFNFPVAAINRGYSAGTVRARLSINAAGNVTDVQILAADPPQIFNRAAITALEAWKFNPGADKRTYDIEVDFKR